MIRHLHTKYINSKLGKKSTATKWVYFILLFIVLWFGLSMTFRSTPPVIRPEPRLVRVTVETLTTKDIMSNVTVFGHTEASERVNLRIRTSGLGAPGSVEHVVSRRGATLKKDEPILRLRMEDREAQFNRAKIEFETAQQLFTDGLIARIEYVATEAAYRAAVENYQAVVLRAPFDGVLANLNIEQGQFVSSNENVGLFLRLDPIKIKAELPEKHIGRAKTGSIATVTLPNGRRIDAMLTFISPSANQTTRTFTVELEALNRDNSIVEGLTAEIRLPLDLIKATKLPVSSCLTFSENGDIGVNVVDANNIVRFYPIDIVREEEGGLWVSGLPSTADVIVLGQEFVKPGERVDPVFASTKNEQNVN